MGSGATMVALNAHDGSVVAWGGPQVAPTGEFRLLIRGVVTGAWHSAEWLSGALRRSRRSVRDPAASGEFRAGNFHQRDDCQVSPPRPHLGWPRAGLGNQYLWS